MPTVKTSVLRFTEPLRGNFRTHSTLTKLLLILTLLLPSVPGRDDSGCKSDYRDFALLAIEFIYGNGRRYLGHC